MSYSPNLPISSSWRSSLALAFQVLRRVKFIIEGDWAFGTFDPQTNYNGMTVTNKKTVFSRYLLIGKFLFISINLQATLAAPFTNTITISLPEGLSIPSYNDSADGAQGGASYLAVAGASEVGYFLANQETNAVVFRRPAAANYIAGTSQIRANFFLEIL